MHAISYILQPNNFRLYICIYFSNAYYVSLMLQVICIVFSLGITYKIIKHYRMNNVLREKVII